ncbi:hypothetical protein MKJ04_04455 [Pontibacter sp. E15-1]|uniref:DUF2231 domain-containing protein n=1 Tax=Pontibacter sp. E15-1 TaxID=2919918 RepID=UPI001F4F20EB|nr:DUF2231 domain-containing protein [Pontibacter sp. E15-1]MCJ8164082.1 hypothetical protein [Pontibacter sp. E15-1]
MSEPAFWRTEVWHPLTVHLPIAVLLLATLAKLIGLPLKPAQADFWQRTGAYLLYVGSVAAWVSVYTGDMADGVVSRKLCDPTVLKSHEQAAFTLAYLFSAAAVLELGMRLHLIRAFQRLLGIVVVLLLVAGSGFLVYTAHLGATIVYQQAGGVHVPSSDCAGY